MFSMMNRRAQYNQLMGDEKAANRRILRIHEVEFLRRELKHEEWALQRGIHPEQMIETKGKNFNGMNHLFF